MPELEVVILAAGEGKRMRSGQPKVAHCLAGRPLLRWVADAAIALGPRRVHVVYGSGGEAVRAAFPDLPVAWVHQAKRLGTGHAVEQAMPAIEDGGVVLVLYGDVPLVSPEDLRRVVSAAAGGGVGLLTVRLAKPDGYGRIVRDASGRVTAIVEDRDATVAERAIDEVNTGILAATADRLRAWLAAVGADNAQGERYLTDVIAFAVAEGVAVETVASAVEQEVMGVNDRVQLAELERFWQRRRAREMMLGGATVADPERLDVRGVVTLGHDVSIDVNVVFEGTVKVGDRVRIGPNCVVRDAEIGDGTEILANCVVEGAKTGPDCRIGPFSRLRPGAILGAEVHVGNYVEVKNSTVADGSKANHLTYIGDSEIGRGVNVGAGTITCNYDGANKHRTVIEDGAFIGSGTELVAPVRIGENATIGAGSTISRDTPAGELTLERSRQKTVAGWKRPVKVRK